MNLFLIYHSLVKARQHGLALHVYETDDTQFAGFLSIIFSTLDLIL